MGYKMKPKVSVIVCTYNDGQYLYRCISNILDQTFKNFELIIVNDNSTDNTEDIVKSFKDKRIRYFKLRKNSGSIGKIRNFSITKAKGEYVFFTDGDCYPKNDWLDKGLKAFNRYKCLAIEGKIVYNKDNYKSTLSDRTVENNGNQWMTANMAYKREVFKKFNFNPEYVRIEDREIALKIKKIKEIPFVEDSIVYHQKKTRTISEYLKDTKKVKFLVKLIKEQNDKINMFRILNPKFLFVLIFPPIILTEFIYGRIKSWNDLKLLPFVWIKAIYMRYIIWKTAIEKGVFVI